MTTLPAMKAIATAVAANVPVLIWGDPGEGKTAKLSSMLENWGYATEVLTGNNRDATDFLGLPSITEDGYVNYAPFGWVKRLGDGKSAIILDEFNTAKESVMNAMLRIVQERWVGDDKLPEENRIIAIANPPESATFSTELRPAIANRFMHVDWAFDSEEWLDNVLTDFENTPVVDLSLVINDTEDNRAWAASAVTGFLRVHPSLLNPGVPEDPTQAARAWPSPRAWTNALNALSYANRADEITISLILKGLVGEEATTQFLVWNRANDLADPRDVIDDPTIIDWENTRPDLLFTVMSGVSVLGCAAADRGDKDYWRQALLVTAEASDNGYPDVAMPAVRQLWHGRPEGVNAIPKTVKNAYSALFVELSS